MSIFEKDFPDLFILRKEGDKLDLMDLVEEQCLDNDNIKWKKLISEKCLSKQRVKEAIEKSIIDSYKELECNNYEDSIPDPEMIKEHLLKELKL